MATKSRAREWYGRAVGVSDCPDLDEAVYALLPTLERRYKILADHFSKVARQAWGVPHEVHTVDDLRLFVANQYIGENVGSVGEAMEALWAAIDEGEIDLNEARPDLRALLTLSVVIDKLRSYHLRARQRSLFKMDVPAPRKGSGAIARLRGAEVIRMRTQREDERQRIESELKRRALIEDHRARLAAQGALKKARKAAEKKRTPKTADVRVGDQFLLADVGVRVEITAVRKTGSITKFQVQPVSDSDRERYKSAWWWGQRAGAFGWLTIGQLRKLPGVK